MVRMDWMNLNGLWDYQLRKKGEDPQEYTRKILVPYPVESSLSGIADSVGPEDVIYYRREFEIPSEWEGRDVLLHFEASDWETMVFVNDKYVGSQQGGYDPFIFNISNHIILDEINRIVVSVSDPSDLGNQPRGKQVLKQGGIWYTPTSGIWQTIWLEPVPKSYIKYFLVTPVTSKNSVDFDVKGLNCEANDVIRVSIMNNSTAVAEMSGTIDKKLRIKLNDARWWSPSDPFLYDVKISLLRDGVVLDEISSYFGYRSINTGLEKDGFVRLFLNDEIIFHNGTLDQGFWPDGLYTPPTDEAMKFDIQMTKEMGFNMLRKHVKVENRRFYYWCDKLGIMVWQDMPSTSGYVAPDEDDLVIEKTGLYEFPLERMIITKYNNPSIVMWVAFNEGWGQFSTEKIVDYIYSIDSSRLVNNASGWADRGVGDVIDIHHYPDPRCPEPESKRASVLGEFGGLGLYVEGHTWEEKNWGYKKMNDSLSLLIKYEQFYTTVWEMMEKNGLAAAVYTQTTDVETETNGLMTYDREIIKMNPEILYSINTNNYVPAPQIINEDGVFNTSVEVEVISADVARYTLDGSIPNKESKEYTAVVTISENTIFSIASFKGSLMSMVITKEFIKTEKVPPVYYSPFDKRYTGGGFFSLIDGQHGSLNFSDGKWQGYRDNGMDVVIDLGAPKKISSVSATFLRNHEGWIFLPQSFIVMSSNDMQEFTLQGEVNTIAPESIMEPGIERISVDGLDIKARYIRVKANTIGPAPRWHEVARERPSWVFIDEIIIE